MPKTRAENVFTAVLIFINLLPILCFKYFLTGDGPCHMYNAAITWDFLTGNASAFYKDFFLLNKNLNPNWFSHFTLGFLLQIFNAVAAEKIFLSAYIILFILGFRKLILAINKQSLYLLPLASILIYHHVFQMGFYNFSYSFVFFFFIIALWIRHYQNFTNKIILLIGFLLLLVYFTHPAGLFLTLLCLGLFTLATEISGNSTYKTFIKSFFKKCLTLLFVTIVPATLLLLYTIRQGSNTTELSVDKLQLFKSFYELTSLINVNLHERFFGYFTAGTIALLILISFIIKVKKKYFSVFDTFFLAAIILFYMYINQPGSIGGVGIVPQRLQFIPYILLIIYLIQFNFKNYLKTGVVVLSLLVTTGFFIFRFPVYKNASEGVEEYLSVNEFIEEGTVVLPLNYTIKGKTPDGKIISDQIYLFMHAADYLGAEKELILLGNYEANTGWFPLKWVSDKNPFWHLGCNEGIENIPPCVDINYYENQNDATIDYIITWCLDDELINLEYTQKIMGEINNKFQLIYTSQFERVKLYKRIRS